MLGTDHVELIVGNAKQSAYYYMAAWGFQPLAFKGLETGSKDSVSYVLRQDKITLVLTTPLKEGRRAQRPPRQARGRREVGGALGAGRAQEL